MDKTGSSGDGDVRRPLVRLPEVTWACNLWLNLPCGWICRRFSLECVSLEHLRSADTARTQTQPGTFAAIRAGKIRKLIHCQQEQ